MHEGGERYESDAQKKGSVGTNTKHRNTVNQLQMNSNPVNALRTKDNNDVVVSNEEVMYQSRDRFTLDIAMSVPASRPLAHRTPRPLPLPPSRYLTPNRREEAGVIFETATLARDHHRRQRKRRRHRRRRPQFPADAAAAAAAATEPRPGRGQRRYKRRRMERAGAPLRGKLSEVRLTL